MAGKFEMDTSRAGIFSRAGSTGSPVSGFTPGEISICGLGVELGRAVEKIKVDVGGCELSWQAVNSRTTK